MAIGLLQACAERRLRVPEDLSIVGWDDVPYASLVTPPLTTVRVPRYELGQAAARKLLELMAGRPAGAADAPLALQLVVRRSSGPPGGGPSGARGAARGRRSTSQRRGAASAP
jgi:DNA-binding LacI/PurR family transcriptional regulator